MLKLSILASCVSKNNVRTEEPWGALCYLLFDLKISYVQFLLYFSSILKCVLLTLEKTSKLLQSIFLQYGKTIYFHMHLQLNVAIFFNFLSSFPKINLTWKIIIFSSPGENVYLYPTAFLIYRCCFCIFSSK